MSEPSASLKPNPIVKPKDAVAVEAFNLLVYQFSMLRKAGYLPILLSLSTISNFSSAGPCTAQVLSPSPAEYYTHIAVKCDQVEKQIIGDSPHWKDDQTLVYKKFVMGNLATPTELKVPLMTEKPLTSQAREILDFEHDANRQILKYSVRIPTLPTDNNPELSLIQTNEINLISGTVLIGPEPTTEIFVTDEMVKSSSGTNIPINYVKLKSSLPPKGVVIFVHGGSASTGEVADRGISNAMSPFARKLLEASYVIVNASYEGDSILSEGNYLKLKNNENRHPADYYRGEIQDLLSTERFITTRFPGTKILYHGVSHGALLVNLLAGKYARTTQAVAFFSDSGIWDLPTASNDSSGNEKMSWYLPSYLGIHNPTPEVNWNDYGKQWPVGPNIQGELFARMELKRRLAAGESNFVVFYNPEHPSFLDRNPSTFLLNIKKPFLIRHGRNDKSVLFSQHEKLVRQLQVTPNPNIQIMNSSGGHCIQSGDDDEIARYLNFVTQYLAH